jgi:secreted trypsin-like serine protease
MKLKTIILGTLVFLLTACGGGGGGGHDSTPGPCEAIGLQTRIINGTTCSETNSPVVRISLQNLDGTYAYCSGSLITASAVLTAGHCFRETTALPSSTAVAVNGAYYGASEISVHPDYRVEATSIVNDAAVIKLSGSVSSVIPLALLYSVSPKAGDTIYIAGYGLDEQGALGILKSGSMTVAAVDTDHITCNFTGRDSNTCSGDSGGPAILVADTGSAQTLSGIVGITSSGLIEACARGDISIFTNIQSPSVLNFIVSKAAGVTVR